MAITLRRVWVVLALVLGGCGESAVGPSPPPAPSVLTGHVVSTVAGKPLGAVNLTIGGVAATSDAVGTFQLTANISGTHAYTLEAPHIVTRHGFLVVASRDVTLEAIARIDPFDLEYYRALVRGSLDHGGQPQPLRRWTVPPRLYLRTVDESGRVVDERTLATARSALHGTAETLTHGRIGLGELVEGSDTRLGVAGWITVRWMAAPGSGEDCGESDVAVSGGSIDLFWQNPACACDGTAISARTVRHGLGHGLGLWHSPDPGDLMSAVGTVCDQVPSVREMFHAAILYSRPVGNTDPDDDPPGIVLVRPARVR